MNRVPRLAATLAGLAMVGIPAAIAMANADHASRARFQWTMSEPPVPSPRSTAVVLTTTRSPTATGPTSCVSTNARRPESNRTRWRPSRAASISTTVSVVNEGTPRA